MFEVGKKYKHNSGSKTVYSVVFSDNKGFLVEWKDSINGESKRAWVTQETFLRCYEEYKEPRKVTFYVNIYERSDDNSIRSGGTWSSREDAVRAGRNHPYYIDSVEYEYTEKV